MGQDAALAERSRTRFQAALEPADALSGCDGRCDRLDDVITTEAVPQPARIESRTDLDIVEGGSQRHICRPLAIRWLASGSASALHGRAQAAAGIACGGLHEEFVGGQSHQLSRAGPVAEPDVPCCCLVQPAQTVGVGEVPPK